MKIYTKKEIKKYQQEIKELCYRYPDNFSRMLKTEKYKYLYDFIIQFTPLLNNSKYNMATKCYWVIHNIKDWSNELVCCRNPTCNKPLTSQNARVFRGYIRPHCCKSCSQADPKTYTHIVNIKKKKYGNGNNVKKQIRTRQHKKYIKLKQNKFELFLSSKNELIKFWKKHHLFKFKCNKCNTEFYSQLIPYIDSNKNKHSARCYKCFPTNRSKAEIELFEFCKNICDKYNYAIVNNYKNIIKYKNISLELDIVIPDIKLAIEFDGIYYHSEEFYNINKNKHPNKKTYNIRKIDKTILAENIGWQLIHIDENKWNKNKDKIKLFIQQKITNTFSFNLTNTIEIIDRSIHNKVDTPPNYKLIKEIPPTLDEIEGKHIYNCGYLIYQKVML